MIIDFAETAKNLGMNEEQAKGMLTAFLVSVAESRTEIDLEYHASNTKNMELAVHKFYGGLCYVGVPRLREAVKKLLSALRKNEIDTIDGLYQQMLLEITAVEVESRKFI